MKPIKFVLSMNILLASCAVSAQNGQGNYSCNGDLHMRVKELWEKSIKHEIESNQIAKLMLSAGDVYPLYDIELYLHNFVAMSRRCQDRTTLAEIAQTLLPAFDAMSSAPRRQGARWICRGGPRCNTKNGLLNKEVELTSLQFLGLTTAISTALASDTDNPTISSAQAFISKSTSAAFEKLGDYSKNESYMARLRKNTRINDREVGGDPNSYILRDHEVWMLTMLGNLAGTHSKEIDITPHVDPAMQQLARNLNTLFKNRTFTEEDLKTRRKTAEIDRGFWRLRDDTRYAGYEGSAPPSDPCTGSSLPRISPQSKLALMDESPVNNGPPLQPVPLDNVGWDISHARRLVPLFDAMRNYGRRFAEVYAVPTQDVLSDEIARAYAHQLTAKLWNQDKQKPLFSNFWSGANGWYRVGYQDGVKCNAGYPPYGLSISIPVGGYLTWSAMEAELTGIGQTLYALINSSDKPSKEFVERYYEGLSSAAPERTRDLNRFMFYASLVR